jgi:AraC-like DNA-binding protein
LALQIQYCNSAPDIAEFVSAYYYFSTDGTFEDIERADVAQFRFVLKGTGRMVFANGQVAEFNPVNVIGPRTKACRVISDGPGVVFGVGVRPSGWIAFTQRPAHECIDQLFPGYKIFGRTREAELWNELAAANSFEEMVAISNRRAGRFYASVGAKPHPFVQTVDRWLESALSPDVKDLQAETGLSARQIERLAKQYYGVPPKLLARKYRALRTAHAISRGTGDWQDFIDQGYYDQSHCIREIKAFTGITPSAIRAHASKLTAMTFDHSQLLGKFPQLSGATSST